MRPNRAIATIGGRPASRVLCLTQMAGSRRRATCTGVIRVRLTGDVAIPVTAIQGAGTDSRMHAGQTADARTAMAAGLVMTVAGLAAGGRPIARHPGGATARSLAPTGPTAATATGAAAPTATAPDREPPGMSIRSSAPPRLVTAVVMDRCEAIRGSDRGPPTRARRHLARPVREVPAFQGLIREVPVSREPIREVIRVAAVFRVRLPVVPVREPPIRG